MKFFLMLLVCSLVAAEIKECGYSSVYPEYIIGGHDALQGAWPWQIGIWIETQGDNVQCGGSILSEYWVLTAAHCVTQKKEYYTVVAGVYDQKDLSIGSVQKRYISEKYTHPGYHPIDRTHNNDVALLRLKKPLVFNKYVSAVCLPEELPRIAPRTMCYATGWGRIHSGRSKKQASLLQQTGLPIVTRTDCEKLNTKHFKVAITNEMVCAGYGPKRRDEVCHGDSGGPLVCQSKMGGAWVIHGVTSWGPDLCSSKEGYSVFARITSFVTWIRNATKNLS